MITKTVKENKRHVKTYGNAFNNMNHTERVMIETWWFLKIIPLYTKETLIATNI